MDPADVTFLQAMIAHHQEALEMATEYLTGTSVASRQARVAALARGIVTAQTAEIAKMSGWLTAAGKPVAAPDASAGMDMSGD